MPDQHSIENHFLNSITEVIQKNISNEQFGVSELAHEAGMSRSNLLRKIQRETKISASQFIRQVRLEKAMELLKEKSFNVSEVSYQVGFSSTSYFIKCFRDHYGYPPGEVGKRDLNKNEEHIFPSHQLAAIMFTDIQGYTALMQKNEETAIDLRNRHREVINTITSKYNGKILQYYGDGTLSTFNSAIDAVKCGIEMQMAFQEKPLIPVRIGIHSGDIMFTEDGIIGDGVNVASRIESLAVTQSVFISEKVYDEVKNQPGIQTASMGKFELKNVDRPMEVYAITNPGLTVPKVDQISGKIKRDSLNDIKESNARSKQVLVKWGVAIVAVILIGFLAFQTGVFERRESTGSSLNEAISAKSIAVLPFINDSNDSTNVYFINGLMEATLNNLQKIKDLRVISRTSVESYRNNSKATPEIARALNVKYLVEGSGQKIGDRVMLHIQLIDAQNDQHIWSEQYTREVKDIFDLQTEVAKNIADQIQVIITPEETARINKAFTDDPVAYDYFLKGFDLLNTRAYENYDEAIHYFQQAIEEDAEFARAYAAIAITYYYMDEYQLKKKYTAEINHYADQALLYDDKLPQSLIAKALFYMSDKEYEMAASYFEKALEFNPNDDLVFAFLVDLYANHLPNTEKYLEYALRGLRININAYDSITTSFIYLHISNAFIQTGFVNEAEQYINKSLEYYPQNLYSEYVKAYILFAKSRDLQQTKELLIEALEMDTTRLDILQEVGKTCYYLRDYESAYKYYKRVMDTKEALNLDIYPGEMAKIGLVYSKMGKAEVSEKYFTDYKNYAENDQSIYKHLSLTAYYAYNGETQKAMEHFRLFSEEDNYHYWIVLFLEIDPLMDNIKNLPEFKEIMNDIENKFREDHEQIKATLKEEKLI